MTETKDWKVGELIRRIAGQAHFSFYRQGVLYYRVVVQLDDSFRGDETELPFSFPVPASDLEGATVNKTEKPITLMRYIRKALQDGTFVRSL